MKPIGMPAYRLTASSIWNSFQSSGKRHLVLTGAIGSGKTTLLSRLFPQGLPGITTWAEPGKAVYMRENNGASPVRIAAYDASVQGTTARMVLVGDAMCAFGIPILRRCLHLESDWVGIDEIGFLEETCEPYKAAIRDLFARKQVAAVVRKQDLPFLNELRSRPDVFLVDLDQPFGNAGCVIMASGLGKRFGENKLMVDFLGRPLMAPILDVTEGLFGKRVVVTRHKSVADYCKERGIRVVIHALPHRSDTVRLGMEEIGETERCMFCPGDQPLVSQNTLASLLLSAVNQPDTIWRTCCDGVPGSPVLFPRWSFRELRTLPEGRGGGEVIRRHPETCKMLPTHRWELMDADTPEVLEQLRQYALRQLRNEVPFH